MSTSANNNDAGISKNSSYITLLAINLIIMLFPPIHLAMANGSMKSALVYFIGAPAILVISMFVLNHWSSSDGIEE